MRNGIIKKLYHGSHAHGIERLLPYSKLHGTDVNVVYLTDSYPYSLFYIWDSEHNLKKGKHVTAWIRDGIVYYEEQFPRQLEAFYKGVKGYVYVVEDSDEFAEVDERESMWYSEKEACIASVELIEDVYDEIMKCSADGRIKIIPFEEVPAQKIKELHERMASGIVRRGLLRTEKDPEAEFYKRFFPKAWMMAHNEVTP